MLDRIIVISLNSFSQRSSKVCVNLTITFLRASYIMCGKTSFLLYLSIVFVKYVHRFAIYAYHLRIVLVTIHFIQFFHYLSMLETRLPTAKFIEIKTKQCYFGPSIKFYIIVLKIFLKFWFFHQTFVFKFIRLVRSELLLSCKYYFKKKLK